MGKHVQVGRVGPQGIPITRAAVLKLRNELGPETSITEVARFMGCQVNKIRNLFTPHERRMWLHERLQRRQLQIPGLAVAQVKAVALIYGKTPSAEQSGVCAKWMDYCGGYNRILAMAGLVPLKRQPSAIGKVRRGTVCGLKAQRREHE